MTLAFTLLLHSMQLLLANSIVPKADENPFFVGYAVEGMPSKQSLEALERDSGMPAQLVLFYQSWPSLKTPPWKFPEESLKSIWENHSVPCLTWEPFYIENGKEIPISFRSILHGDWNDYIDFFAEQAALFRHPFILRFAQEMNLERYHWGSHKEDFGPATPLLYQATFHYIVDRFRLANSNNVLWAFCPNAESHPDPWTQKDFSWNHARNYYPGHNHVDILGMDGYDWGEHDFGTWQSHPRSFEEIFGWRYRQLKEMAPDKPIIVFETATTANGAKEQREWLTAAVKVCRQWHITALLWFQVDKEFDWRLLRDSSRHVHHSKMPQKWLKELSDKKINEKLAPIKAIR